jgi:hypothetical protein
MATQEGRQQTGLSYGIESLRTLDWTAIALAIATPAIHLYLFTTEDWLPFLLAGGFLGAVALLIALPKCRHWLYPVGALFVVSQIVGYLVLPLGPVWIGVLDKAIQVALIVVLVQLFRMSGKSELPGDNTQICGESVLNSDDSRGQGDRITVEFTASQEVAEYFCTYHPESMRGDIQVTETTPTETPE